MTWVKTVDTQNDEKSDTDYKPVTSDNLEFRKLNTADKLTAEEPGNFDEENVTDQENQGNNSNSTSNPQGSLK